ncbi:hypothetical protein B1756_11850 [Natrarchaeobaculum aegyptiacum]|uniref:ZIP family metal transporter n=1 Tax=Natrarchaeobaculum aegyptiacum TaxID=745377 RepID=A0A2Z2I1R3_9EURY|nr:hypothetical protein B1756_11850 [Natrarchaeobaculum aegyptiacum]
MGQTVTATTAIGTDSILVPVLVFVVAFAHLLPDHVPVSSGVSEDAALSATGGVSVVYAFVHLFPELDERRTAIEGVHVSAGIVDWTLAAHHVYAIAFLGLALFYGLERLAQVAETLEGELGSAAPHVEPVFWVHVGGFAVYNAFIGYALVGGETGADNVTLFAVAMAVHLYGNDRALEGRHRAAYQEVGRWVLTASVFVGAAVASVTALNPATVAVLLALLTGGIVFNAIKDELPRTRESRFWPFVAGSAGYGVLLLVL